MANQEIKVSVHSLSELKNTSDDAVPNYLNSLGFKQSHTLTDVRLALGYSAFALCAATFYWDFQLGFESTKYYTAAAVALYAALNAALTFWIWGVEKGTIYVGTNANGEKIEISSSTEKHVPEYKLTIKTYTASMPSECKTLHISRSFTQWFDAAGHFIPLPFQQMFAGEVPLIGTADPLKAITAPGKAVQIGAGDDAVLKAAVDELMAGQASGMETTPKKTTKSRKKT